MSTITTQLTRMVKAFSIADVKGNKTQIPAEIRDQAKAVVFFKKLAKGTMSQSSAGVLIKRTGTDTWSQPIAVHPTGGDLYWGSMPSADRADVVLVLTSTEQVAEFQAFGRLAFVDPARPMNKGIVLESSFEAEERFKQVLAERPELIRPGTNFSFGLVNGGLFPVHIENPSFAVKARSNSKFYCTKETSIPALMQADPADRLKGDLLSIVKAQLTRNFAKKAATKTMSPEDSVSDKTTGSWSSPTEERHPASATLAELESLARDWSASTDSTSSGASSSGDEEESIAQGSTSEQSPTRVRTVSFDFSC